MANPTTNYGWPMPTSTDLVTDLPADFALFGQPVDTSLKALNPETTLGDIAYRSSTSNTNTRLGIGSTSQVLTVVAGVPAWSTPASGALTLIRRSSFSAVATTGTTFDGVFTSTYKEYLVVIEKLYAATTSDMLEFQLRIAGVTTTGTYMGSSISNTAGASTFTQNAGAPYLANQPLLADATATGPFVGTLNFHTMLNSQKPAWNGLGTQINSPRFATIAGTNDTAGNYDGILFKSAASNITGTVAIYGLATA